MTTLVEELMRTSRMAAFIFESLALESYPNCLFWMDEADFTFCFLCPRMSKKDRLSQEVQRIFLDYIKFKVRKSVAVDKEKRSVFLQALKASPYVKINAKMSTADKKICIFTDKFKDFIYSKLGDFSLPIQLVENNTLASTGNPVEVFIPRDVGNYWETFMFLGSPSLESNDVSAHTLELSSVSYNGSSPAANNAEAANGFQDSFDLSNGENTHVPSVRHEALMAPVETESSVPCISFPETEDNLSSLYSTCNESFVFGENLQPAYTNGEGSYVNLSETQLSPNLPFNEEEFPSDYDPVEDLILKQSQEPRPNSAGNQIDLRRETRSSSCEILSIHGLEIVGNRVHVLDHVEMKSAFDSSSPKYYMLKIKDVNEPQ